MRSISLFYFMALWDSKGSAGTMSADMVARAGPSGVRSDGSERALGRIPSVIIFCMTKLQIPILFENEDVLVVDKPSGLAVHGSDRSEQYTLADWFVENYPQVADVGEPLVLTTGKVIRRGGIVHRLDADTSGVIILAKTQEAYEHLKKQFHDRLTKKVYNAFVYGNVRNDRGIINRPIGKSRRDPRLRTAMRGARGLMREAVTHYRVLARVARLESVQGGATYLELRPKTGRTHQIRVHMQSMNHPVVADPLYAPEKPAILGFNRLALHARQLTIELPNGEERVFEAPLPDDFVKAEGEMGKNW